MLAKLPFRSKLILVASIPLVALMVFAGATVNGRLHRLDRAEQYGDIIGPYQALNAASRGLSDEAVASATRGTRPTAQRSSPATRSAGSTAA